jgi:cytochrome b6-f complex iron-sulfur subunit
MAEKKKMSVAEILAAARAEAKGAGKPAAPAEEGAAESAEPVADKPAAVRPSVPKPGGAGSSSSPKSGDGSRPSVSDILAMARAKKEAAAESPAAPKATAAKPAAKPAAAKPAIEKPTIAKGGPKTGVQRDTASILAAARSGAKPGPVSKAEAPARTAPRVKPTVEKPVAPPAVLPARPVKPELKAKKAAEEEDRRGFLEIALGSFMAVGFTALSVTGGLATLGLARFLFPNVLAEPPSKFKVGFKDGFPAGKVETKYVPQYGVWVVNGDFNGQPQLYALKTVCTHLGCTPSWLEAEQKFKCPCHGSGFYKDGINFEGPAPRPLERYAIRIADDGQVEIDKSRTFQEELGQWADPESFVPV